ncbi:unnamed protein product [Rhizophagus irregularis]|nr:unnamed protein product [Rhizophagus irregularis]
MVESKLLPNDHGDCTCSRLIGRNFNDQDVQSDMKNWPFKVVNNNGKPYISVEYKHKKKIFSLEEILSMVLTKMKEIAEAFLDTQVVTMPAYLNDSQRQAIKDARVDCRVFQVKSIAGNAHHHFVNEFNRKFKKYISSNARAIRRLRTACIDFYTSLTCTRFEELNQDLFRSIIEPIERVLQDAKITKVKLTKLFWLSINPDEAAAYGAAVQAAISSSSGYISENPKIYFYLMSLLYLFQHQKVFQKLKLPLIFDEKSILIVSAVDKATGRSNKITITNDKGRLSKKESNAWKENCSKNASTNDLEYYAYNLRNLVQNIDDIKKKLEIAIENQLHGLKIIKKQEKII